MKLKKLVYFTAILWFMTPSLYIFAEHLKTPPSLTLLDEKMSEMIVKANKGDVTAQAHLASLYNIDGTQHNLIEAARWYTKAAEQGDASSQYWLAQFYSSGLGGLPRDKNRSFEWMEKAAKAGNGDAQYAMAGHYKENGSSKSPLEMEWLLSAAKNGNGQAQFDLGTSYELGNGLEKNSAEALYWLFTASQNNVCAANMHLGDMYFKGDGVRQDYLLAAQYYQDCPDLIKEASSWRENMAYLYEKGLGVAKDPAKAQELRN